MRMLETMILGGGPGGTGPLVWAAGAGVLGDWLDRGVAVVDRCASLGGTVGRYSLNADTLGGTFLECLDTAACDPRFAMLRDTPSARALAAHRASLPPLPLVGRFLEDLGTVLARMLAQHPRSCFLGEREVTALRLRRDGSVLAELCDRFGQRSTLRAASAVLALGGRQPASWDDVLLRTGPAPGRWRHKIVPSDRLLGSAGAATAAARLGAATGTPRAVILGGSHSAFSAAWTLLERLPAIRFGQGGVQILHRTAPRVFYASRAEAAADGYVFSDSDVCPATGRVHRLGGLRGDGRTLWRRMQGHGDLPPERRAEVAPLGAFDGATLRALLDAADLIVPAFGYRLATVPVYGPDGEPIPLACSGPSVDADARLRTASGGVLGNVFGIGLGSGFRPWGTMAGEPGFQGQQNSLWLYQHGLGALIHDGVRRWAAERRGRSAAAALPRAARELAALCLPADLPAAGVG
jgi:hypothetical protein